MAFFFSGDMIVSRGIVLCDTAVNSHALLCIFDSDVLGVLVK